jgi:hypothetical protein
MKTYLRAALALILCTALFPVKAEAASYVSAPTLDKVYINSDSLQAVLYWRPSHSAADNPIYDYAFTYDGVNFAPLGVSFQNKYESTISLPLRANALPYYFAIAPIIKSGLGSISNRVKGEINPYTIPIQFGEVVPTTDGFTFKIKDILLPGYSSSVQFLVTDLEGSDTAYVYSGKYDGTFEVHGMSQSEKLNVTVYKKVTNCPGFLVTYSCPYSTAQIISGSPLQELNPPKFGSVTPLNDGFRTSILNYDSGVKYTFDVEPGVSAELLEDGSVEVHGLAPSSSITLTVTAAHSGFSPAKASVSGSSLAKAYVPVFQAAVSTQYGFYIRVNNFNEKYRHVVKSAAGNASISTTGVVTVNGLGPSVSVNVFLSVYNENELVYETTLSGTSSPAKKTAKK